MAESGESHDLEQGAAGRLRGLYRRKPRVAWAATAALAGVAIAVVVILTVSGGSEPANVTFNCSVSDSDGSTVLTVRGKVTQKEAEEGCDGLAAKLSGEGRYWRVGLPEPPSTSPEIVCGFNAPKGEQGTAMVEVNPESLTSPATTICGQLAHEGWTQFTQGGVMGPWQHEYGVALEAEEEAEAAEAKIREEEQLEAEAVEDAIVRCEQQAEAVEKEEISTIEQAIKQRVSEAPSEERGWEIEEEGWAEEEDVWSRTEGRDERCRETEGGAEAGGTEYR
ncbi:MAG TPA: hypothetical protein VG816_06520 [Solirubrobacterales bacterium]|nr:hypothetical protein [Solirubrobacterales bacterium]